MQTNVYDRKQISGCLVTGMGVKVSNRPGGGSEKQHKDTSGDDGNFHYLDGCDVFTGVFTRQNVSKMYTLIVQFIVMSIIY